MRVIATTDISRVINGSTIYQTLSLVEQFNVYAVISCMKIFDYAGRVEKEEFSVLNSTSDKEQAAYVYESNGGDFNESNI
jgi:hypothetical protein